MIETIPVIVVDGEPLARRRTGRLPAGEKDFPVAAACPDGPAALEALVRFRPRLLFLDIQMPGNFVK